ncbi:MAG: cytochrome d ubiquinol oxidase subunit II [Pseudomonadota bacterium]
MDASEGSNWLPLVFVGLMGLSMLIYVVLDGFDLGVGILVGDAEDKDKDMMIASIGPFWDANETWLVLGVGLLLVAFPAAHGAILTALYLPVFAMLIGLILRGVAFDFRAKVPADKKWMWNRAFLVGSVLAAVSQGYMLGIYIVGLNQGLPEILFGLLTGVCLAAAYAFIGACWLIMKTEGALQLKAIAWAKKLLWLGAIGMLAVSAATPLVSPRIFEKWFSFPNILLLAPIPLMTAALFAALVMLLREMPMKNDRFCWAPFVAAIGVFVLGFVGLAYSFYPYIVPDKITIYEAASAPESLFIILIGAITVLPVIVGYSIYAYWVFRGKAQPLSYGG